MWLNGQTSEVDRMEENRLAKITRDNRPPGVRSRGRPKNDGKKTSMQFRRPKPLEEQASSLKRRGRRRRSYIMTG